MFALSIAVALSPNLLFISGIHGDYDDLHVGTAGLADELFAVGRPVAALLSGIPIWPLHSLSDLRWVRIFSLLTMVVVAMQMLAICISVFRTSKWDAMALCVGTFLVSPFIYSVLQPSAWAPHLITMLLSLAAYLILSKSNLQALSFLTLAERGQWRALPRQTWDYLCYRPVWTAGLLYLLALFDAPAYAVVLVLCPTINVLFSPSPRLYRLLIGVRDIAFIGVMLVVYGLSAKFVYFPLVRSLVYYGSEAWQRENAGEASLEMGRHYQFNFNLDLGELLARLGKITRISADLWFLPQTPFHLVVYVVVIIAAITSATMLVLEFRAKRVGAQQCQAASAIDRSPRRVILESVACAFVPVVCFIVAQAPILLASGGFITYRSIPMPPAVAAVVFIWAVGFLADTIERLVVGPTGSTLRARHVALVVVAVAAISGNFYTNYLTLRLSRNELAYFKQIVRDAAAQHAEAIVLIDPRPYTLPEDHPENFDQEGRPIPPFELGCMSSYCIQTGAIVHVAAAELGLMIDKLGRDYRNSRVFVIQGDLPLTVLHANGADCAMLSAREPRYPPNATQGTIDSINYLRSFRPFSCVVFSLAWRNLAVHLGQ